MSQYLDSLCPVETDLMKLSKTYEAEVGGSGISLSPHEGHMLSVLLLATGAKKVIEIGTLTGYSAQWILKSLPADGQLWTLEKDPERAGRAEKVFSLLQDPRLKMLTGDAPQTLKALESEGPFDAVFIDANKKAYLQYGQWAETHLRKGGLMIADNVFLEGSVFGETSERFSGGQVKAMQEFNQWISKASSFTSMICPSREGLAVSVKNRS